MTRTITRKKYLFFSLFFLSGFAGLIYESVWAHYVKLIMGHAAYAQTLVLVIFMGGLALGAWLTSRLSERIRRPFIWYAVIEFVIGLFGIVFHREFLLAHHVLFELVLPTFSDSAWLVSTFKWSIAGLILLPQAILLGATFPVMGMALVRLDGERSGHSLAMLYFTNSIGAAIGVLVSGFVLIRLVGLPGTTMTAGLINVLLAIVVWFSVGGLRGDSSRPMTVESTPGDLDQTGRLLLLVAMLTGGASFLYEIGWIRMLSLVLGSSTQAFELMLSAFIGGLAFGGYFIRSHADRLKRPLVTLAWVQMIMGLMAVVTLPAYAGSFRFMSFLVNALSKNDAGYVLFNLGSHGIAIAIMVPATFMAGMTLPLLTAILIRSGAGEQAIGRIYSANTLGAILSVVLAINVLMPLIGASNLVVLGAGIDLVLGAWLLWHASPGAFSGLRQSVPVVSICLLVLGLSLTPFDKAMLASGVYRFGHVVSKGGGVPVFHEDGKTATISYLAFPDGGGGIKTNGKTDAYIAGLKSPQSGDEITMAMAGVLPMLYAPDARTAAVIGIGSGMTTHTLLGFDSLERVDSIEIEQKILEGAKRFGDRVSRTFSDPRSRIHIDDAKSFFSVTPHRYDIIVSEPSNPWVSGVSSLFTREFYQHVNRSLAPNGVLVQWLQVYDLDLDSVSSVMKALGDVFPVYKLFHTNNGDMLIVASQRNSLERLDPSRFGQIHRQKELDRVGLEGVDDFMIRLLGDKQLLAPLFGIFHSPVNSDYFPYLDQRAPLNRFRADNAYALSMLHNGYVPVIAWLMHKDYQGRFSTRGRHIGFYESERDARQLVSGRPDRIRDQNLAYAVRTATGPGLCSRPDPLAGDAIFFIAASINPFLERAALERYWSRMIRRCRNAGRDPATLRALRLHGAIGLHDNRQTLALTREMLDQGGKLPRDALNYLLIARLTALIDQGDYPQAVELVQQHRLDRGLDKQPIQLQLLVARVIAAAHAAPGPSPG